MNDTFWGAGETGKYVVGSNRYLLLHCVQVMNENKNKKTSNISKPSHNKQQNGLENPNLLFDGILGKEVLRPLKI